MTGSHAATGARSRGETAPCYRGVSAPPQAPAMSLLRAVVGGFALGALGLGIASYLTADSSSLLFSPGEQAMFGGFVGAVGGAVAGLLLWLVAIVGERTYRLLQRTRNPRS